LHGSFRKGCAVSFEIVKEENIMRIKLAYFTGIASLSLLILLWGSIRPAHTQTAGGRDCTEAAGSPDGCNTIEGSSFNQVEADVVGGTIAGGGQRTWPNQIHGYFGTVCGGLDNKVGEIAAVCGGSHNLAAVVRTFVGGGMDNKATADSAAIVGGINNQATGRYAFVGGGFGNRATDLNATVGGGSGNLAGYRRATVAGGSVNQATSVASTVGGGVSNIASGAYATIGGGTENSAAGLNSTIAGGAGNQVSADGGAIAGGIANRILDNYSAVSGGWANQAGDGQGNLQDAAYASVGGGKGNIASGAYATVPGGASNRAEGDYSFAAGRGAVAQHDGSLVLADSNQADFTSTAANELAVRATGGVRLVTAIDAAGEPLAGVLLPAGSGAWATLSDREAKMDFAPVDGQQILSRLAVLPIQTWRYKAQPGETRHLGPAAQDFYAAFGVGEGDRTISTVDADGVALASIQALYGKLLEKDAEISAVKTENQALRKELERLETRMDALEASRGERANPLIWIGVIALVVLVKKLG
jgi:trimeric autotransporter adhesin